MGKINFTKFNGGKPRPVEERFWEKVDILGKNECWEWLGSINEDGYGSFKYTGGCLAHRCAWVLSNGDIPQKMEVCHRCDNPSCCNPNHLFLGTHTDNMKDMISKGRCFDKRGERNSNAKLTKSDVVEIYRRHNGGEPQREIARDFGVTQSAVSYILKGKSWKLLFQEYEHVSGCRP